MWLTLKSFVISFIVMSVVLPALGVAFIISFLTLAYSLSQSFNDGVCEAMDNWQREVHDEVQD